MPAESDVREPVVIQTERFLLRELTPADVSDRYLQWLRDADSARYITSASQTRTMDDLRSYVAERAGRDDVLFLGIFDRVSALHIGNLKYEPIDQAAGYAVMGILIGDGAYRGKGVAPEVLVESARWLRANRSVGEILLGVDSENAAAIRAYEKVGFARTDSPYLPPADGCVAMSWKLKQETGP